MTNESKENQKDRELNRHELFQSPTRVFSGCEEKDKHLLTLSLSFLVENNHQPPPPPPPPSPPPVPVQALLSQPPPPQLPLQLSPSHPLYMPPQYSSVPPMAPLPPPPQSPFQLSPSHPYYMPPQSPLPPPPLVQLPPLQTSMAVGGPLRQSRVRRHPTQATRPGKAETVPAPFPWATTRRATVHSLDYLLANRISAVKGEVQCKKCEREYEIEYDLREKFDQVGTFIAQKKATMHDRAPAVWVSPVFPSCEFCKQENAVKPVISEKKRSINWLFLLLGQFLGCCTLEQLRYFCKHTKNHRTGAKDRVLYLTYLGLCKQLDPDGPFDR